jgi:diamine N-acetyltransferase
MSSEEPTSDMDDLASGPIAAGPGPEAVVSLREVTGDTVREICRLSDTLSPVQQRMVAPNAISIAEAHFEPHAWFRAIYADETPVGFIMLYIGPDTFHETEETLHYLWRFMIAGPYQSLGYGRRALEEVIADLRAQGVKEFFVSCGEGEASPEGFYRRLGFERNGEMVGEEVVLLLKL